MIEKEGDKYKEWRERERERGGRGGKRRRRRDVRQMEVSWVLLWSMKARPKNTLEKGREGKKKVTNRSWWSFEQPTTAALS